MRNLLLGAVAMMTILSDPATSQEYLCVNGTLGNDTLTDPLGFNCLSGYDGNDNLYGGSGPDWIDGAFRGNGTFSFAESYVDGMWGQAGVDVFLPGPHRPLSDYVGRVDVVKDFQSGEKICSMIAFTGWYRKADGAHAYVVLKTAYGDRVLARVLNMGTKAATVKRCKITDLLS